MFKSSCHKALVLCSGVILTGLLTIGTGTPAQSRPHSMVFPPEANPYGKSYGEWAAAYFETEFSTVWDPDACSSGRVGNVELLQATLGGPGEWTCEVPTGTAFLFPVITAFFLCPTDCGPDGPAPNGTVAELREAARSAIEDVLITMTCEIDGVSIDNLTSYRSQSPVFSGDIVAGCLFNAVAPEYFPVGPYGPAVTDGYFLMARPLPAGPHTIHYHAIVGPLTEPLAETESTHHITVTPGNGRDEGASTVEPATWGAIKATYR